MQTKLIGDEAFSNSGTRQKNGTNAWMNDFQTWRDTGPADLFSAQATAFAAAIVAAHSSASSSDASSGASANPSISASAGGTSQGFSNEASNGAVSAAVSVAPVVATATAAIKTTVTAVTATPANTTTTATPAWLSKIVTSSIAKDMAAAITSGSVTEAGLSKLMTNLVSSMTTAKASLTSQQFGDLKTIAANLGNGITSSSYINYVFGALVNGNSANTTWTGGAAASVKLGNLAVGSSATQVSQLTGKWLLGTDTPSSTVKVSSYTTTISYSIVSKPLFASTGPVMSDINQGGLGDCYFLSSCAEIASHNSALIKSMFTDNGNGTYGVRFYTNGQPQYVTVNAQLANGGNSFDHANSSMWSQLAEKAWAQFQAGGLATGNTSVNFGNSYSTIGNGGYVANALEALTGASAITEYYGNGSSWAAYTRNSSLNYTGGTSGLSSSSIQSALISALNNGYDVVLSSYTNAKDASNKTTLVAGHAMSIYGFNNATNMFKIYNPWGTAGAGQSWQATFEVGLSTLLAARDVITVDNVNAAISSVASVAGKLTSSIASLTSSEAATSTLTSLSSTGPKIELASAA